MTLREIEDEPPYGSYELRVKDSGLGMAITKSIVDLMAGMNAHIAKPIDVGVMLETLGELLRDRQ